MNAPAPHASTPVTSALGTSHPAACATGASAPVGTSSPLHDTRQAGHVGPVVPAFGVRALMGHSRALTRFGLLLWLAMVPALLALELDERTLRGVSVWAKPIKFMAAIGLLSLTTAWFIGLLSEGRRNGAPVRVIVWTLLLTGTFEIGYIALQAALGQASHFNVGSAFHRTMYMLMGAGALAMTATQLLLAWQIARHARADVHPLWRDAVVLGLALTFVLGTVAGGLLGGLQPPSGAGLPVLGWHLGGGDLRPAHFLGMHAQQALPLAGALIAMRGARRPRALLLLVTGAYVVLWGVAMVDGLDGAMPTRPF